MANALPAQSLQKTIAYFYLLSYCPPEKIADFRLNTAPVCKALAESAGLDEAVYFTQVIPEVCRRIVAFHQATRELDRMTVGALEAAAKGAGQNARAAAAFQEQMAGVAALPGRAKPENRLYRARGCQYCQSVCRFGYFTLISDPHMAHLKEMLAEEAQKPAAEQSPLGLVHSFAFSHLAQLTGAQKVFIKLEDMTDLSYCLLILGMAKSRLAAPERQLRLFQEANQEFIRRQVT